MAVAWNEVRQAIHGPCGEPIHESFHPDSAYDAEGLVCKACQAKALAEKRIRDDGGPDAHGLYSRVWKIDGGDGGAD